MLSKSLLQGPLTLFCFLLLARHELCVAEDVSGTMEEQKSLEIYFVDVGEGDCTIIYPDNDEVVMIDAGNPLSASRVSKVLRANSKSEISHLIFTHPHLDHIGGLFGLLPIFSVGKYYDNGQPLRRSDNENDMYRWYDDEVRIAGRARALRAGDRVDSGNVTLTVLWPPTGDLDDKWNENSLVLSLRYGDFTALLMGDALAETEAKMSNAGLLSHYPILKAGHHGSIDTASEPFLKKVSPDKVIVSVATHDIHGYPSSSVVQRYEKAGAEVLQTDLGGTIRIRANKDGHFDISKQK